MSTALKLRRGTTAQHSSFTGAAGEITVDTDKKTVVVHDGTTAGGMPLVPKTMSDGTANGVAYLNGSKVVTSGSALTFDGTNFATTGAVRLWNSGSGNFGALRNIGTSSANRIQLVANGAVIEVDDSYNAIFLNSSGGENARFTSTGLGIGTSSPAYKLDVKGDSAVRAPGASANTSAVLSLIANNSGSDNYCVTSIQAISEGATWPSALAFFTRNSSAVDTEKMRLDSSGNITPGADNTQTMGSGSKRWSVVYAGTGTINTSDAREKTSVRSLTSAEITAAKQLSAEIGAYQFLSAVEAKGDAAREHIGMTVQKAIEILEANGLEPFKYGFICYDQWDDEYKDVVDANGDLVRTVERQKMVKQTVAKNEVKVVNGVATLVTTTEEVEVPLWKELQVVDADGNIVMVVDQPAQEAEVDEHGNVVTPAKPETYKPMTHQVADMETVQEHYRKELVRSAGDRYSFRPDELLMFIARGFEARMATVESSNA